MPQSTNKNKTTKCDSRVIIHLDFDEIHEFSQPFVIQLLLTDWCFQACCHFLTTRINVIAGGDKKNFICEQSIWQTQFVTVSWLASLWGKIACQIHLTFPFKMKQKTFNGFTFFLLSSCVDVVCLNKYKNIHTIFFSSFVPYYLPKKNFNAILLYWIKSRAPLNMELFMKLPP